MTRYNLRRIDGGRGYTWRLEAQTSACGWTVLTMGWAPSRAAALVACNTAESANAL